MSPRAFQAVTPVRLNPDVPAELERIINKTLEKDRDIRCQSAAELRADLKRLKRDTESGRRSAATFNEVEASTQSRRLLWRLVAGGMAVALVGAGFLAWRSFHSRTSDAAPIHSIAVLSFLNASKEHDHDMDYLSEGLSEEITNSLARLPNLQVMARSTGDYTQNPVVSVIAMLRQFKKSLTLEPIQRFILML